MFRDQHSSVVRHTESIIADVERARLASRARKLRKRDGRTEYAEAGGPRPPAVDC